MDTMQYIEYIMIMNNYEFLWIIFLKETEHLWSLHCLTNLAHWMYNFKKKSKYILVIQGT